MSGKVFKIKCLKQHNNKKFYNNNKTIVHSASTVSYTHLDVYKRQTLYYILYTTKQSVLLQYLLNYKCFYLK